MSVRCLKMQAIKSMNFIDRNDFYFVLVATISLFSLIYLISGASISYKETIILSENKDIIAKLANLSIAHFSEYLGKDFALKLPNLIFHFLNLVLIYLISNKLLKYKQDSILCVGIYAIIPGVIMQGGILNESILILFVVLLICYIELICSKLIYPLAIVAVFIGESSFMLFLALFFYSIVKKNVKMAIFAMICFAVNLYIYGISISGRPRGNFLDVIGELSLLYSPPLFVYFVYTIYRNFTKYKPNLLLYVSGTSLLVSIILSIRQGIDKEIFMFMSLCGIPLMIRQFLSEIRTRLPMFQQSYKNRFIVIIAILLFEASLLIFSKQIYQFSNDDKIFLNQFYIAKEIALELKNRNISRVSTDEKLQKRLLFYGIGTNGQPLKKVKKGGNIIIKYNEKIVARYVI